MTDYYAVSPMPMSEKLLNLFILCVVLFAVYTMISEFTSGFMGGEAFNNP